MPFGEHVRDRFAGLKLRTCSLKDSESREPLIVVLIQAWLVAFDLIFDVRVILTSVANVHVPVQDHISEIALLALHDRNFGFKRSKDARRLILPWLPRIVTAPHRGILFRLCPDHDAP